LAEAIFDQVLTPFDVGFGRRNLELDDGDLGILHVGGSPCNVTDLLVKEETFHKLGVVDDAIVLLHDLDIVEINHGGPGGIHDKENVDDEGSKERGVLADDLVLRDVLANFMRES